MMTLEPLFGTEIEYTPNFLDRSITDWEATKGVLAGLRYIAQRNSQRVLPYGFMFSTTTDRQDPTEGDTLLIHNQYMKLNTFGGIALWDGGRVYQEKCWPFPELSTPECINPYDLLAAERRGETIIAQAYQENGFMLYKDAAGRGANSLSCGMHRNFCVSAKLFKKICRELPSDYAEWMLGKSSVGSSIFSLNDLQQKFINWLVLEQLLTGQGKTGSSFAADVHYQISARSEFISKLISGGTVQGSRALINTRDNPFADPRKFRRLHIINGEGNRSPWSRLFGLLTGVWLMMLEDKAVETEWIFLDPLWAIKKISWDYSLRSPVAVYDKQTSRVYFEYPAVLLNKLILHMKGYIRQVGGVAEEQFGEVVDQAEQISLALIDYMREPKNSSKFKNSYNYIAMRLDWAIKHKYLLLVMKKLGLNPKSFKSWLDPRIVSQDLKYHELTRGENVWRFIAEHFSIPLAERYFNPEDYFHQIPLNTRAYLRGLVVASSNAAERIIISDWEKLLLKDPNSDHIYPIYLRNPYLFGKSYIERIFNSTKTDLTWQDLYIIFRDIQAYDSIKL